jgi:hypothetical protein
LLFLPPAEARLIPLAGKRWLFQGKKRMAKGGGKVGEKEISRYEVAHSYISQEIIPFSQKKHPESSYLGKFGMTHVFLLFATAGLFTQQDHLLACNEIASV